MRTKLHKNEFFNSFLEHSIEASITSSNIEDFNQLTDKVSFFIEKLREKKVCPIVEDSIKDSILDLAEKLGDFLLLATAKRVNIKNKIVHVGLRELHDEIQQLFKRLKESWVLNPEDLDAWAGIAPYLSRYTLIFNQN